MKYGLVCVVSFSIGFYLSLKTNKNKKPVKDANYIRGYEDGANWAKNMAIEELKNKRVF